MVKPYNTELLWIVVGDFTEHLPSEYSYWRNKQELSFIQKIVQNFCSLGIRRHICACLYTKY